MTKKEIGALKAELKKEIIKEMKDSKVKSKGEDFDFEEYKKEVVKDDIKKVQAFIDKKIKWYWFIPLFGALIYLYQYGQLLISIDRGIVRQNIVEASLRWLWIDWIFFYGTFFVAIINYLPFSHKCILRRAIVLTKNNKNK